MRYKVVAVIVAMSLGVIAAQQAETVDRAKMDEAYARLKTKADARKQATSQPATRAATRPTTLPASVESLPKMRALMASNAAQVYGLMIRSQLTGNKIHVTPAQWKLLNNAEKCLEKGIYLGLTWQLNHEAKYKQDADTQLIVAEDFHRQFLASLRNAYVGPSPLDVAIRGYSFGAKVGNDPPLKKYPIDLPLGLTPEGASDAFWRQWELDHPGISGEFAKQMFQEELKRFAAAGDVGAELQKHATTSWNHRILQMQLDIAGVPHDHESISPSDPPR